MPLKIKIIERQDPNNMGIPLMICKPAEMFNKLFNQHLKEDLIEVCKPTNHTDLYCILHEQGHIATIKDIPNWEDHANNVFLFELYAWAYAYRCVQPQYHAELTEVAVKCLGTYQPELDWYTIECMLGELL